MRLHKKCFMVYDVVRKKPVLTILGSDKKEDVKRFFELHRRRGDKHIRFVEH